jgi:hypothetical protein
VLVLGFRSADSKGLSPEDLILRRHVFVVVSQPRRSLMSKKSIMTVCIVAPIFVLAVIVGAQAAKPKFEGDTITQTFSQGEPCATATVTLNLTGGADPLDVSESLFAAIKPVKGLNSATLNLKTSSIEVGFCESSANEDVIRKALLPTGLVAAGQAVPAETVE